MTLNGLPRTCVVCGMDWIPPYSKGSISAACEECRPEYARRLRQARQQRTRAKKRAASAGRRSPGSVDHRDPNQVLALVVTNYRVAIEIATLALMIGRHTEALQALLEVEAPERARLDSLSALRDTA